MQSSLIIALVAGTVGAQPAQIVVQSGGELHIKSGATLNVGLGGSTSMSGGAESDTEAMLCAEPPCHARGCPMAPPPPPALPSTIDPESVVTAVYPGFEYSWVGSGNNINGQPHTVQNPANPPPGWSQDNIIALANQGKTLFFGGSRGLWRSDLSGSSAAEPVELLSQDVFPPENTCTTGSHPAHFSGQTFFSCKTDLRNMVATPDGSTVYAVSSKYKLFSVDVSSKTLSVMHPPDGCLHFGAENLAYGVDPATGPKLFVVGGRQVHMIDLRKNTCTTLAGSHEAWLAPFPPPNPPNAPGAAAPPGDWSKCDYESSYYDPYAQDECCVADNPHYQDYQCPQPFEECNPSSNYYDSEKATKEYCCTPRSEGNNYYYADRCSEYNICDYNNFWGYYDNSHPDFQSTCCNRNNPYYGDLDPSLCDGYEAPSPSPPQVVGPPTPPPPPAPGRPYEYNHERDYPWDGVGTCAHFGSWLSVVSTADASTLYVGDYRYENIRKIDVATATVTTVAGPSTMGGWVQTGNNDYGYKDGVGDDARFYPWNMALTPDEKALALVSAYKHKRLRLLEIAAKKVITLAGHHHNEGTKVTDGEGTLAAFSLPRSTVVLPDGLILVKDTTVRKITVTPSLV